MATKASFSPAEWTLLLESPMMAGMAVGASDPSGLFGMLQEGFATGSALVHAKTDLAVNQLVKAVAEDFGTSEGRGAARDGIKAQLSGVGPGDIKAKAIDTLRQASGLLDAKAREDSPAFKTWLTQIGQNVAEAAKEGGFLGFGGVRVSDAENATLAEIASALDHTA